eukprot:jgi/Chrzof1/8178/Cz03g00180.t1
MLLKHIPNYGGPAPDVPIDNLWCLVPGLIVARVDFVLRVVFSLLYGCWVVEVRKEDNGPPLPAQSYLSARGRRDKAGTRVPIN